MKLFVFSVYDVKSEIFGAPMTMAAKGQARRAFAELASDKNTQVGKFPEDFKLVCIGRFDDGSGMFSTEDAESMGFASEYVKAPVVAPVRKVSDG